MTAAIYQGSADPRPESYRIDCDSIELGACVPTDKTEWGKRAAKVFQQAGWQFDSVKALLEAQSQKKQSIGVVDPREVLSIDLRLRSPEELKTFEEKRAAVRKRLEADRAQLRLFEEFMPDQMKDLELQRKRIHVTWRCGSSDVHDMQIMDWEVVELQRRMGDDKALAKVREVLNLNTHATRFFLGNMKVHPKSFTIVGLWYPKRMSMEGRLF
jgi:hypothetical protein